MWNWKNVKKKIERSVEDIADATGVRTDIVYVGGGLVGLISLYYILPLFVNITVSLILPVVVLLVFVGLGWLVYKNYNDLMSYIKNFLKE